MMIPQAFPMQLRDMHNGGARFVIAWQLNESGAPVSMITPQGKVHLRDVDLADGPDLTTIGEPPVPRWRLIARWL